MKREYPPRKPLKYTPKVEPPRKKFLHYSGIVILAAVIFGCIWVEANMLVYFYENYTITAKGNAQ